ncbi:MAG: undecaprenyl-diphosphate phosphatase [Armatimonadetes bacterium]|nr:undecaprenyl-diphosphate phosphatase [Armatimonadota bacterium]
MNVPQSLVYGVIQGLTEFIPVSSTAHLILAQNFSSAPPTAHPHTFDTIIQIGTVVPVLAYFRKDWVDLARAAVNVAKNRRVGEDLSERLVQYILLGSVPAGVAGLLFEKPIERLADPSFPEAKLLIGGALIGVGALMCFAEATSRRIRALEEIQQRDAWLVGVAQALALFPGVSRSGATITAGLFAGLTREAAARFSFLLMTPIMLAATGYKLAKLVLGAEPISPDEWQSMLVAAAAAGVTGYAAIAFLLGWLRSRSLTAFAVYRFLIGAWAIGLYLTQR